MKDFPASYLALFYWSIDYVARSFQCWSLRMFNFTKSPQNGFSTALKRAATQSSRTNKCTSLDSHTPERQILRWLRDITLLQLTEYLLIQMVSLTLEFRGNEISQKCQMKVSMLNSQLLLLLKLTRKPQRTSPSFSCKTYLIRKFGVKNFFCQMCELRFKTK